MNQGPFSRRFDNEDRTKLTDSAYSEIKQAVIELKFKPGDVLRESAIGEELGVSKTPVREALIKLEHDGLIQLIPFRGALVTGYEPEDIREILELRAILQSECVRRVAREFDTRLISRLQENVSESQQAADEGDIRRVATLFDEFDEIILARIDNRRVMSLIRNLQDHMMRIGQLTTEIPGRTEKSIRQHGAIVEALNNGDEDAASAAMKGHIESVMIEEIEALGKEDQRPASKVGPPTEDVR